MSTAGIKCSAPEFMRERTQNFALQRLRLQRVDALPGSGSPILLLERLFEAAVRVATEVGRS